jgi:hypothetical protein
LEIEQALAFGTVLLAMNFQEETQERERERERERDLLATGNFSYQSCTTPLGVDKMKADKLRLGNKF